jgi:hypothetical protein
MEHGRTFRISIPKYPTQDPDHRILALQRSFTHYYFYIRDEVLGPIIVRVASFFPFHATYWLNGHSFIHKIFERSCEIGLWRLTANRISEILGVRLSDRDRPDRTWPSRFPRLLEKRLPQTV